MRSMEYSVYIHTFPNGKKYVGISKNVARRFRNGKGYQGQPIMWSAIQKYGWKSVRTKIVCEHLSESEAKQMEIDLINKLNSANRDYGYNQTLGGEGTNGRKLSDEEKRAIGLRMSKVHKGVPLSDEHKAKLSAARKGRKMHYSEDGLRRILEANRGRVHSFETRKKISENTKKAMAEKNMSAYLSEKWRSEKDKRKAKLRITLYDRYGIIPAKYNLRDDVILLGLDKEDYSELFEQKGEL